MNRINKKLHLAVCAALATLAPMTSLAAPGDPTIPVPNAGQILQQIERDSIVTPLPVQPAIEQAAPEPEDQGPMVVVKQFKFEGNKVLSAAELEGALEALTGHEISIAQLKGAVDLIAAFYREKGFLATATLPEQDITEGVVIINIVEAVFGDVKVDGEYGKDYKRVRPSVIERVVNASAPKGQSLDQNKLDRSLAVLQKMIGFNITPSFQAGSVAGTTDLLVKVKDQPLLSGSIIADNTGGRSTGRDKQTASLNFASPFGFGDAINLTMLEAKGVNYGRAAYSIPLGSHGLKVGLNGSYLAYDVIIKDNGIDEIKPKGNSMVYGIDLSYPLYTSKTTNLNIEANYDRKKFVNKRIDTSSYIESSNYRVDVYSLILSGTHNDSFLAGAINNASLDFGMGRVNLDGSLNKEADSEADNTHGHYKRTRLNISRNQFLTDSLVLSLEGSGQWANRNLDSSEKFYLGGINGVRAYPTSEGAGSEGYMFKLELRKYLPYNFNVSLFMDEGKVKQYQDLQRNDGSGPLLEDTPNEYRLKGYGATVGWSGPYNSSIKATYSTRMGENPNPAGEEKRNDQDGSLRRHVLWLSGGIAF